MYIQLQQTTILGRNTYSDVMHAHKSFLAKHERQQVEYYTPCSGENNLSLYMDNKSSAERFDNVQTLNAVFYLASMLDCNGELALTLC